jgi:cytochrome c peroxidase
MPRLAGIPLLALVSVGAGAADPARLGGVDPAELGYTYAVGAFAPQYTPPAPGTYALPPIDTVSDHPLLDADGRRTSLFALKGDGLAVVSFVYMTCVEAAGCPLSLGLQQRLDRALADDARLARSVHLITISFDPERDTPERLTALRRLHHPRTAWRFATARSGAELAPLLEDFGQPVAKLRFDDGAWTGLFRHVLKVYLVDRENRVRNVYSTGFLNPELVLNDARTVLMER